MLWSAGLEAPRHVWVHGFLMAAGGERMSKSRGNFFDPNDFVAAFGSDGARYVVLREVPFDRDAEVSWDSFVRRYNADLANDFGNLVNRTVSMTQPLPRRGAAGAAIRRGVGARPGLAGDAAAYRERLDGFLLHDALAELWAYVGSANKVVDAEQPWVLAKAWKAGRRGGGGAAARRPRATWSRRAAWSAWPPRRSCRGPRRGCSPSSGTRTRMAPDGNGGPPILDELAWGAHAGESVAWHAPEPLFPRLDVEARHPDRRHDTGVQPVSAGARSMAPCA